MHQILAEIYRAAREIWPSYDKKKLLAQEEAGSFGPGLFSTAGSANNRGSGISRQRMIALADASANTTVTIRIDQLKDLAPDAMRSAHQAGDRWFISKRNKVEGVVVRQNLSDVMPADLTPPAEFRELDIYRETPRRNRNSPKGSNKNIDVDPKAAAKGVSQKHIDVEPKIVTV